MIAVCLVAIAICGDIQVIVETSLLGKIINENREYYLVDFSESKKGKRSCSDLTEPFFVEKQKCVLK